MGHRQRHQQVRGSGAGVPAARPAAVPSGGVAPAAASAADRRHWRNGYRDFQQGNFARALESWRLCRARGTEAAQAEALFRLALKSRRPAEAASLLDQALGLVPHDPVYLYHRALTLWRAGARSEAVRQAGVAAALAPPALAARIGEHEALMRALLLGRGDGDARGDHDRPDGAAATDAAAAAEPGAPGRAGDWRAALASVLGAAGQTLPDPSASQPGSLPPWLHDLLSALRALSARTWSEAAAAAQAAEGAGDLPDGFRDLAAWASVEARAQQGRWRAVLAAVPAPGPLGDRVRAWQRWAAAAIWTRAMAQGDVATAAAMLPRLTEAAGPRTEVRQRMAAAMGAADAARGDWASAVRHWRGAGDAPAALAQPLAVAHEHLGRGRDAAEWWRRVWAAARRGDLPAAAGGLPPSAVAGLAASRAAELLGGVGDAKAAVAIVEEALAAPGTDLPAPFCLSTAQIYAALYEEPCPEWERMGALLERGLRETPDDLAGWAALAQLRRRSARTAEALEAARRCVALAPDDVRYGQQLLEDIGRAMLEAWARADLDAAERLTATLTGTDAPRLPPSVRAQARMLEDLACAVWERARRRPRPRPISRWDGSLRTGEPGIDLPMSAYVFRGMLSLLGGHEHAAEAYFRRVFQAEYWEGEELRRSALAYSALMRWIGYAHCWARQWRGAARRPGGCEQPCSELIQWMGIGTLATAWLREPPGDLRNPPAVLAGCPRVPEVYAEWRQMAPGLRSAFRETWRDMEEFQEDDEFGLPDPDQVLNTLLRKLTAALDLESDEGEEEAPRASGGRRKRHG